MNDWETASDHLQGAYERWRSNDEEGRSDFVLGNVLAAAMAMHAHFSAKQPQVVERWRVEQVRFREVGVGYGFVRYALEDEHPDAPWQVYFIPAGSDEAYEAWFATQEAAMAEVDARADQIRARRDAEVKK